MHIPPSAFGLYPSSRTLHVAADALRQAQFRQTDISIMYSDGTRAYRLRESIEQSGVAADEDMDDAYTLGGMLSALSGVGAVMMMDDGPFLAAGPILATLCGAGHGLGPSLRGIGIPETSVERFEGPMKKGGLLLSVQCDDHEWAERALTILRQTGASEVETTAFEGAACSS